MCCPHSHTTVSHKLRGMVLCRSAAVHMRCAYPCETPPAFLVFLFSARLKGTAAVCADRHRPTALDPSELRFPQRSVPHLFRCLAVFRLSFRLDFWTQTMVKMIGVKQQLWNRPCAHMAYPWAKSITPLSPINIGTGTSGTWSHAGFLARSGCNRLALGRGTAGSAARVLAPYGTATRVTIGTVRLRSEQ